VSNKNETVQNNILGYNNFDSDLYKQVVHACDLQKDFSQFPNGDETLVGSKGISLSGGQKQRVVSLVIYSKKALPILRYSRPLPELSTPNRILLYSTISLVDWTTIPRILSVPVFSASEKVF
jgi:hypothetical protein